MRMYYGTRISPNKVMSTEGYLLCLNVPIARTGDQIYYGYELGLRDRANEQITVHRSAEEVFSPATIASFVGQPVTNEHPNEDVTPSNYEGLMKGVSLNVRRGEGKDSDKLIADLKIIDPMLRAEIEAGKTEVSCGYECCYTELPDGSFEQSDIRGNHIAIVTAGRAGHDVAIRDSLPPVANKKTIEHERSTKMAKKSNLGLWNLFARAAKDAEPEEIAEMAALVNSAEKGKDEEFKEEIERREDVMTNDDIYDLLREVLRKLDEVLGMNKHEEHEEERALDELEEEIIKKEEYEEREDDEEIIEPEKKEYYEEYYEEKVKDAAVLNAIRALKPVIAAIPDKTARDAASKELAKALRGNRSAKGNTYANIAKGAADNAAKMSKQGAEVDYRALEAAYNAKDPHRKEIK